MHIIIDGYNLIRQSDTLRPIERAALEDGRKALIHLLTEYKKRKGHTITVVFDGWQGGNFREEQQKSAGVRVIYSRIGESADEVIKRLVRARRGEETLVVTSDREIRDATERAGSVSMLSPDFEMRLLTAEHSLPADSDDEIDSGKRGSGKKGPARRLSKREKKARHRFQKI